MLRIFTILNFRVSIDSSSRKNDTKTTTKFCLHLGWKKAMSSPSESRNDQCIGNLCVDKIQSPRIRDLCVDKTQSAQICNLCVEKNPRPRRARTNPGRAQLLIRKRIIGHCSNNVLLENRPIIVFPIRKTPVRILAKKTGLKKRACNWHRLIFVQNGIRPDRDFPNTTQPATPSHLQHSQKES